MRVTPAGPQVGTCQGGVAEKGAGASAGRAGGKGRRCMRQRPRGADLRVRLHGGPGRLGGHRRLRSAWGWRLMRHFLPLPPRRLSGRMGMPPVPGALVASARLAHRRRPRTSAAGRPAVAPSPVARRAEEEDLPALGPAAHHEAQCLHETPARAGFWRRVPECATSSPPACPTRTPGRAVSGRLSSGYWRAFRFLGRARLPTPAVGRPTHNFSAPAPGMLTLQVTELRATDDQESALPGDHQHVAPSPAAALAFALPPQRQPGVQHHVVADLGFY
jgi:hypothetical protein